MNKETEDTLIGILDGLIRTIERQNKINESLRKMIELTNKRIDNLQEVKETK